MRNLKKIDYSVFIIMDLDNIKSSATCNFVTNKSVLKYVDRCIYVNTYICICVYMYMCRCIINLLWYNVQQLIL